LLATYLPLQSCCWETLRILSLESKLKFAAPVADVSVPEGLHVPENVPFRCSVVAQLKVALLGRLRSVKEGPVSDCRGFGDQGDVEPGAIWYRRSQFSTRHDWRLEGLYEQLAASFGAAGPREVLIRKSARAPVLVLFGMQ